MKRSLKQSVQHKLESYTLSDDQLLELVSFEKQLVHRPDRRIPYLLAAAAGAIAVFILAFLVTPLLEQGGDIRERIALEVAGNHIKLKPLDVETGDMQGIRDYFVKLDFVPLGSRLLDDTGLQLIGGRYCSLQGRPAAQLRLGAPGSKNVQTLYQAEFVRDVHRDLPVVEQGDAPVELYAKGVRVTIWVEKGLVFALTEMPDE